MEYKEHTGVVVSVVGENATVKLERGSGRDCEGCCACSAFAGERTMVVPAAGLSEGDHVSLLVPTVNAYLSMFLVFILPVMLFFAGAYVGRAFEEGEHLGGVALGVGGAGIVVAFIIAAMVNRIILGKAAIQVRKLHSDAP